MYLLWIVDGDETVVQNFYFEDEARAAYREALTHGAYGYITLIKGEVLESTLCA